MVAPTEPFHRLSTFAAACEEARAVAEWLGEETAVHADGDIWLVLVPPGSSVRLRQEQIDQLYRDEVALEDDDLQNKPFSEDFSSDQDDWARSEEEGWYYDD